MNYSITQARQIIINNARTYSTKLEGKQFLVIYRDRISNTIKCIEPVFFARNYQHLTGILLKDRDGNITQHCSEYFYRKCLDKKIANDEISFKKDGTTQLKLEALPAIMKFTSISKIAGDANNHQPFFYAEKIVGGVNFCLGFCVDKDSGEFVPSSALQKDIKKLTDYPSQVLAIFEREYRGNDNVYHVIKHVAKGVNLRNIIFPSDLSHKFRLDDYVPKG